MSTLGWRVLGKCCVEKKNENAMLVGTIALLLYLVYPSITGKAFMLWKDHNIPGACIIYIDYPDNLFTDDHHFAVQYALGLPMILLYVIGLPLLARSVLHKFRSKLGSTLGVKAGGCVFGLHAFGE